MVSPYLPSTLVVKSLVIAEDFPWPAGFGALLRLDTVVRALVEFGDPISSLSFGRVTVSMR